MKIKRIKVIATFVLCILMQTTYAQKKQTMLQKENLKGKVKSVSVRSEHASVKFWFDKTGKITKKEEYKEDGIIVWDNYVYDKEDRLLSISVYFAHDPTSKSEVTYTYPNDSTRKSHNATFQYDERGNCILEIRQEGQGYTHEERIYNEKNQLVEAFSHNGPERLNIWKTDGIENRAYEVTKWMEPTKRNHVFFEYNELGDVSLITLKTENGYTILNTKGTMTYSRYDNAGNWLEQIFTAEDSSVFGSYERYYRIYETFLGIGGLHITRTIEYYE